MTETRSFRWIADQALSIRAYDEREASPGQFCVSAGSSELTYVLEGELWISMGPAPQQVRVRADEGCLLLAGTPHHFQVMPRTKAIVLDVALPRPGVVGVVQLPAQEIRPAMVRALSVLWVRYERASRQRVAALVTDQLDRASAGPTLPLEGTHNTLRMLEVKTHLERCYDGPIRMPELARRFSLDRYYLVRAFKQNFGVPPLAYVQALRYDHFLQSLMRDGDRRQLIDIAGEAGYGDYSTFCRRIRQRLGRPPSQILDRCTLPSPPRDRAPAHGIAV